MTLRTIAFTSTGNAADSITYSEEGDSFTRDSVGLNGTTLEIAFALLKQWAIEAPSTRWATLGTWLDLVLADIPVGHPLRERAWFFRQVCTGQGG